MNLNRAYDRSRDAFKFDQLNTLNALYIPESINEENLGAASDTKYRRYPLQMIGYNKLSISYLLTAAADNTVTMKVYATNLEEYTMPDEDTAIANTDEIFDISSDVLGGASVTVTGDTTGDIVKASDLDYVWVFIELKFDEAGGASPSNAADIRTLRKW